MLFTGTVVGGKLSLDNPTQLHQWLHNVNGKRVEVTVERQTRKRTTDQNAYYWLICTTIGKDLGYSSDEVHELLKSMFLKKPLWVKGKFIPVVGSTTRMDTVEFTEYIERVRQWAAEELRITIPDPDETKVA